MRSKLTKTIILIVFVVFLGINDVHAAETCTFKNELSGGVTEYYTITLDDNGNLQRANYRKRNSNGIDVVSEDRTSQITFNYTSCSHLKSYNFNGTTFQNQSYDSPLSNSNSNSDSNGYGNNIGSLDPGEDLNTVSCGEITGIPKGIPHTTRVVYLFLQIGVPIALVIFGMLDLSKAITAQKEDEIKKGQQTLIKRIVAAAIVFFVFAIVKALVSFLADSSSVGKCLNCFIKGSCQADVVETENDPNE